MRKIKQFIAGLIVGVMLMSAVFAGTQTIEAFYNNIKISVDGKAVELKDAVGNSVDPFIYNGTTYLPVRAIAEALGMEVKFNETTNTVELAKKEGEKKVIWNDAENIAKAMEKQKEIDKLASLVDIFDRDIDSWNFVDEGEIKVTQYKDGRKFIMPYEIYNVSKIVSNYSVDEGSKTLTLYGKYKKVFLSNIPLVSIDRGNVEYVISYDEYKNNLLPKLLEAVKQNQ
jgi:predicted house-cleaning noncanonical NTP pyrophosphatase (MazG superfamily)